MMAQNLYSYSLTDGLSNLSMQYEDDAHTAHDSNYTMARPRTNQSYTSCFAGYSGTPVNPITDSASIYSNHQSYESASYNASDNASYDSPSPYPKEASESSSLYPTPSSLQWSSTLKLWQLYSFIVKKGREPYLDLLPTYAATAQTPQRVYLDQASPKKSEYPCQFPGRCGKSFTRPVDLERHYMNVHASRDPKDLLTCDYSRCYRAEEAFTRKDHLRDHYRDYHKEDIGGSKATRKSKDPGQALEDWWAERIVKSSWWRCPKDLKRVRVEVDGFECPDCKTACDQDRVKAREKESGEVESGYVGYSKDTACGGDCLTCNSTGYVMDLAGIWEYCPKNCVKVWEGEGSSEGVVTYRV